MAHICHLTVLNPARHSRIYSKMALSQAGAGHRVSIIGQDDAPEPYLYNGVEIIPTGSFGRMSGRRMRTNIWMPELAAKTKADIFQFHTPELFPTIRTLKGGCPDIRLIYDRHEDYPLNIRSTDAYPWWLRGWLANWVSRNERQFARYGDAVFCAESIYKGQVGMSTQQEQIVANKFAKPTEVIAQRLPGGRQYLLYTGTLAEAWGIRRAIRLWKEVGRYLPVDLVVAGHGQNEELLKELESEGSEGFHLVGGRRYVPHNEILGWIKGCIAGFALYDPMPHLRGKIPTKFYEYMGLGKRVLFSDWPEWKALNAAWQFGRGVGQEDSPKDIAGWLRMELGQEHRFSEDIWSWESEAEQMLACIERLAI